MEPCEERLAQALNELAETQLLLEAERTARAQSDALFDQIFRGMSDAVVITDARGWITRLNDSAVRLLGGSEGRLTGVPVSDALGDAVPPTPARILEMGHRARSLDVAVRDGGRRLQLSVSAATIRDSFGKVVGAVYAARDLTETERLRRQLEIAEQRWRLLAEAGTLLTTAADPRAALPKLCEYIANETSCGVAVIRCEEGIVQEVVGSDDATRAITGARELEGRPPPAGSALQRSVSGTTVHAPSLGPDFPLLGVEIDHGRVASAGLFPLVGEGTAAGSSEGCLLFVSATEGAIEDDVVELATSLAARLAPALATARLRASLAQLEARKEADRLREQMASSVSHDIQTPLGVLRGLIATLRASPDTPADQRLRAYVAMERQGERLRRLVQQFLDYTRLEAGREVVVHVRAVDPLEVVHRVKLDFGETARIEVEDERAGDTKCNADPERLDQILANLVSNAVKFSSADSPIKISIDEKGPYVEIAVQDQGRGMTPPEMANLFQKFYRARGASGTAGTGLGLYISRALAEAQGGRLSATSRPGRGSRFTISLARAEE